MAKYSAQNIDQWVNRVHGEMDALAQEVVVRMVEETTQTAQPGSYEFGKIPYDSGELMNSMEARIQQTGVGSGSTRGNAAGVQGGGVDGVLKLASLVRAGDIFAWMWTAPYVAKIHWGTKKHPGYQWIVAARSRFAGIVKSEVIRNGRWKDAKQQGGKFVPGVRSRRRRSTLT